MPYVPRVVEDLFFFMFYGWVSNNFCHKKPRLKNVPSEFLLLMANTTKPKNILVLTASCDEAQGAAQVASIDFQTGVALDHLIVRNLGFFESQKEIHRLAYKHSHDYDFCLKLDGDMVLGGRHTVANLTNLMEKDSSQFDRLVFPVNDFFLNKQILGCHFWRASKTPKNFSAVPPRGDAWLASIPAKVVRKTRTPQVYHAYAPSLSQAIRFGVNRASKALAFGLQHEHWRSLILLERAYIQSGFDVRRGTALLGAGLVMASFPVHFSDLVSMDSISLKDSEVEVFCAEQEELGHPMLRPKLGAWVRVWFRKKYPDESFWFWLHRAKSMARSQWTIVRRPDF